jgi:hypothetical protein
MRMTFIARLAMAASISIITSAASADTTGWSWLKRNSAHTQQQATVQAPSYAASPSSGLSDDTACIAAIMQAQQKYGIPNNYLLAIGLQEAGRKGKDGNPTIWPWSLNAAGEGRLFNTRAEALSFYDQKQSAGVRSIDIGCMQINMRWHPDAFTSVDAGFEPATNVDYAARFLVDLYRKYGNWTTAIGSYHSAEPKYHAIYLNAIQPELAMVSRNAAYFASIGDGAPIVIAQAAVQPVQRSKYVSPYSGMSASTMWEVDTSKGGSLVGGLYQSNNNN